MAGLIEGWDGRNWIPNEGRPRDMKGPSAAERYAAHALRDYELSPEALAAEQLLHPIVNGARAWVRLIDPKYVCRDIIYCPVCPDSQALLKLYEIAGINGDKWLVELGVCANYHVLYRCKMQSLCLQRGPKFELTVSREELDRMLNPGSMMVIPGHADDYKLYADVSLGTSEYPAEPHACTCSMDTIMRSGCVCGGR